MRTTEYTSFGGTSKTDQISEILHGADLESAWKECLSDWEDSSPAQSTDCREFVINLRDELVRLLRDIDDPEEQETVVCLFYTRVKSQWILINTQSGYQIRNGRMEGMLICKAGMLSALLGSLEPVLHKTDLSRITNFLAEPEANPYVAQDAARLSALLGVDVFCESLTSAGEASHRIVVDAHEIESRFRALSTRLDDSERQWTDLQNDMDKTDVREIVAYVRLLEARLSNFQEISASIESMGQPSNAQC